MTAFTVNGQPVEFDGEARTHLADFLREDMGLTATHLGCEHGVCGACTLVVDGKPTRSCITFAASCDGAEIRSLEDFQDDPLMARIRDAFKTHHGLQCGFCTPGMLATAYDIVTRLPDADEARIREELSGNLCRCTGYMGIVAAIRAVLADGPHQRPDAPKRPPQIGAARFGQPAPKALAAKPQPQQPATKAQRPAPLSDGVRLARQVAIDLPAEQVWQVLSDIHQVATCLPGTSVTEIAGEAVTGTFSTRIGPMTARFGGTAFVTYDHDATTGTVVGAGGDDGSRSTAQGEITFAVSADGPETCVLNSSILYRLTGPLAQLGRPAIVEGIVDSILDDFTSNIVSVSTGQHVVETKAPGALGFLISAIKSMIRNRGGAK